VVQCTCIFSSIKSYRAAPHNITLMICVFHIITYFPWYQCDITHVIIFYIMIVYSYAKLFKIKSTKTNMGWYMLIYDKKNLPYFVMWYDFYPTRCAFFIPSPRPRDRKHTTRWIKIISHHKPWEILYVYTLSCDLLYVVENNSI
jgi:hypothetical protein